MEKSAVAQLEQNIKEFIELNGWDAFEELLHNELGFRLVSIEGGRRVYVHPTGEAKATIRHLEVEVTD